MTLLPRLRTRRAAEQEVGHARGSIWSRQPTRGLLHGGDAAGFRHQRTNGRRKRLSAQLTLLDDHGRPGVCECACVDALMIAGGLGGCLFTAAFLGWFVGLFCGRMPQGLRDHGAYSLRYSGQLYAYLFFVTAKYPDSGPRPDPASP
jgi:hypothetical protein